MSVYDSTAFDSHEEVHHFHDPATGLHAITAIHSTALGPAAGGCRLWTYANSQAALDDVLRLSRGMTYKNAMVGLPLGGGKTVVLQQADAEKTEEMFVSLGRFIDTLAGRYIIAEDVGVTLADMQAVARSTPYVAGLPRVGEGAGGDPSPWTAYGVYLGIRAAVERRLGRNSLDGLRIAVQGLGNVGYRVCRRLHDAGAELLVADVNTLNVQRAQTELKATPVPTDAIAQQDVDVFVPCALGGVLNKHTIGGLKAKVVAGAANNQLADESKDGQRLVERGILYAPDYVINAGGIVSAGLEYLGDHLEEEVRERVQIIPSRLEAIFEQAERANQATNVVADELARAIVAKGLVDVPAPISKAS